MNQEKGVELERGEPQPRSNSTPFPHGLRPPYNILPFSHL